MNSFRKQLTSSINQIAGYKVTEYYRQSAKAGDGFLSLGRLEPDESGFGFMAHWQIVIALGSDIAGAETRLENDLDKLLAAIDPHLEVTLVQPSQLIFDNQTVSALVIEGARGH